MQASICVSRKKLALLVAAPARLALGSPTHAILATQANIFQAVLA